MNCRVHSNPLGCITVSIPIRNTRYLRSFGDLASANNPPKPLLTVESRQHTANESGGSFFGQNNSLVAVSADGFVIAKNTQGEIGDAAGVDFVRLSERILHLRIRHRFGPVDIANSRICESKPLAGWTMASKVVFYLAAISDCQGSCWLKETPIMNQHGPPPGRSDNK